MKFWTIQALFFFSQSFAIAYQITDSLTIHFDNKNYERVIEIYESHPVQNSSNFSNLSGKELEAIGMSYFLSKKYGTAINPLRILVSRNIKDLEHFSAYVNTYYLSRSFKYLYQRDSAIYYSQIGLDQALLTKSDDNIFRAQNNLAVVYEESGNFNPALALYSESLSRIHNDSIEYMRIRSNIAIVYFKIGLLDSAVSISSEVYNYFKKNNKDHALKWPSVYRLAYMEKDYKNQFAESYYHELIEISNSDHRLTLSEIGLGNTLLLKNKDSAVYYMNKAGKRARKMNSPTLLREYNFLKARLFLNLIPNQTEVRNSLDELQRILLKQNDHRAIPLLKILKSKYYLNENMEDSSLYFIDEAIVGAKEFDLKDRISEALTQKFNVLNHFGRYKEALGVKEEEIKVREELFNDRSEAVYQILRTQNEMDKQESTIANQQLEIDNNNLQITIMYISIALVISALVFIFWQYRTRSRYAQKLETMFLDSRHRYMNNLLLLKNWFNEGKTENNNEIISFAQNRIDAISTVNRHLDRLSYNKDTIESKSFLEDISHNLLANREFTSEIENVPINMSVSGPLGMITNEIITNGLKYGEEPYAIRFQRNGNGYVLEIEDHGPGIADPEKTGTGSKVLRLLSRQLKGKLTYQNKADQSDHSHGTLVSLHFKG